MGEEDVDGRGFYAGEGEEEGEGTPAPGSRGPGPSSSSSPAGAIADPAVAARLAPYVTTIDGRLYVRTRAGAALRLDPDPVGDPRTLLLTGAGGAMYSLTLSPRVGLEDDYVGAWRRAFADPEWEDALDPL